jgi:hypothetical protein
VLKPIFHIDKFNNKFEYDKYSPIEEGEFKYGKHGLPKQGYPYTIEYKEELKFLCCKNCNCVKP